MTLSGPTASATVFGRWGPTVAALLSVLVVVAAVATHVLEALGIGHADPTLDSLATVVLGVVLGASGMSGVAQAAVASSAAAHARLDALGAPPAAPAPTTTLG